jgi:hypothetical protein
MSHNGGGGAETPQSPLRIAHDGEFYARLLTKESSLGNPSSFRYYCGVGPGAVPFVWESHPGTPKDAYSSAAGVLPAITPPPSYHLRAADVGSSRRCHGGKDKYCGCKLNRWIKIGFIATVFHCLAFGTKPPASRSSPTAASVKSSSTRWLFTSSGGGADARDMQEHCCYEPPRRML